MKPTHIEHIGIAVRDLGRPSRRTRRCWEHPATRSRRWRPEGPDRVLQDRETKIELLESTSPDGPIGKFLEKRGEGFTTSRSPSRTSRRR